MKVFLGLAMALLLCSSTAWAEDNYDSLEYESCLEKAIADFDMMDCTFQELERQDARLNAAYKKLMAASSEHQKTTLREAQRAWIKFRDTWGEYLFDPEGGTIARLQSALWHLEATTEQAIRLEQGLSTPD